MAKAALVAIWKEWEARNDCSCAELEGGCQFVWSFGVLFSKKACHVKLSKNELNLLKYDYLAGKLSFESEDLERRRLECFQVRDQVA